MPRTDNAMTKPRLGFIGLGQMGAPIALKLIERGYSVTVWGRSRERLVPFQDAGATTASSPAQLAEAVDIILLCVADGSAVEEVVFGANGVAEGGSGDKILVDHSTISAAQTRDLATRLETKAGMAWVDAPVSGGPPGVAAKTLAAMAGGTAEAFARAYPVVMDFAGRFTHLGPVGAGQTTKMINQALCGVAFIGLAEATRLGLDAGIDVERIPEAIAGGRADSNLLQEYLPRMARGDFQPVGRVDSILKDLEIVAEAARATGTAMPITGLATELYRLFVAKGLGPEDNAAIVKMFESTRT